MRTSIKSLVKLLVDTVDVVSVRDDVPIYFTSQLNECTMKRNAELCVKARFLSKNKNKMKLRIIKERGKTHL